MMLPEIFHRQWVEPAALGVVSFSGASVTMILAEVASTPAEYGAVFLAFLVFIGMGVLGIAMYTAQTIAKAAISAFTQFSGDQAKKLVNLQTRDEIEEMFAEARKDRLAVEETIVKTLRSIEANVAALTTGNQLLNQAMESHKERLNRHSDLLNLSLNHGKKTS